MTKSKPKRKLIQKYSNNFINNKSNLDVVGIILIFLFVTISYYTTLITFYDIPKIIEIVLDFTLITIVLTFMVSCTTIKVRK